MHPAKKKPKDTARKIRLMWIMGLAMLLISPFALPETPHAAALAERMLERLGGRTVWAGLRNTINGSQQNRAGEPTVVYAVITMDFEQPRFRIETTAQDLHFIRVINGENSWRLRGTGKIEDVPAELFDGDMTWYAAHVYRTIHRVATRDPKLSLRLGSDGRLEVVEGDKRVLWLKLDAKAEPYAFGAWDDDVGSLSGPWDYVKDGVHHPIWTSSSDGTWRANLKVLDVNVPLHHSAFKRPEGE